MAWRRVVPTVQPEEPALAMARRLATAWYQAEQDLHAEDQTGRAFAHALTHAEAAWQAFPDQRRFFTAMARALLEQDAPPAPPAEAGTLDLARILAVACMTAEANLHGRLRGAERVAWLAEDRRESVWQGLPPLARHFYTLSAAVLAPLLRAPRPTPHRES